MDFNEYQKKSRETAIYPLKDKNYIYPLLGVMNEAGEVVGKIKKIIREKKGIVDAKDRLEIKKEMSDVLWYFSQLATELNIDFDDIARTSIKKIFSRKKRGKLLGKGDNR